MTKNEAVMLLEDVRAENQLLRSGADLAGELNGAAADEVQTLAVVRAAYDWTIDAKGRVAGLVAGDQGFADTAIVIPLADLSYVADAALRAEVARLTKELAEANARHRVYADEIAAVLVPVRRYRTTGEPSRCDRDEILRLRTLYAEASEAHAKTREELVTVQRNAADYIEVVQARADRAEAVLRGLRVFIQTDALHAEAECLVRDEIDRLCREHGVDMERV